jgi:PAS domain S-box-containing protein
MLQGYSVPSRRPPISGNSTRISLIRPWLIILLVVLLGNNFTTSGHAQNKHKKNVLILHSYNYGYGWTDSIMKGIEVVLPQQDYNLTVEYMDTKRYEELVYFQKLYDFYHYKFASKKFDVIICSDDNAFNFLIKYKNDLFAPQTPVVFCGVNFFQDADLKGRKDITGVVENYDIASTVEIIRQLHPDLKEILVISDRTATGRSNTLKARKAMAEQFPQQKYTVVDDVTMDELRQILRRAPAGTVVLYLGFAIDKTGKAYAPLEQSLAMLSRSSKLPFYSVWEFTLESVVGGMITSGFYQGEMAARMAKRLLDGEKVANIPVLKESPNKPMFNYNQMERFGISPSQLPPGSIIINLPGSFYAKHKSLVLGIMAVLAGLSMVIIFLTIAIKKRKRAEEALAEEAIRRRLLVDQSRDGIVVLDQTGKVFEANQRYAQMLGYSVEEVRELHVWDWDAQWTREELLEQIRLVDATGDHFETRQRRKGGTFLEVEVSTNGAVLGGRKLVFCVCRDISARKAMERALRESEEKFREVFEKAPLGIMHYDQTSTLTDCNEKFAEIIGSSKEKVVNFNMIRQLRDEKMREAVATSLRGEVGYFEGDYLSVIAGKITPVRAIYQPIFLSDGTVSGGVAIFEDITERKRAEEALQSLVRSAPMGIYIVQDGKFTMVNPGFEVITGYYAQELIGQHCLSSVSPEYRAFVREQAILRLKGESLPPYEYQFITKNGETGWVMETVTPTQYQGKQAVMGYFMDISPLKDLEEQFLRAQKMEAVGTLAGGIAHDFNNILTAILGNIGLAALDDKIGPRVKDRLAQAEAACLRAQALSQQLLTFAKGGVPVKKLFSVAELLTESTAFTCVGSPVRCETTFSENLWWIEADPGQIVQIFQNLTINAIQAMPTGGTIKVWAENLTLGAESGLSLSAGGYVTISVRDQGMGIPVEHLPRIFDPYFTTKQKGSGLGLASAYAIIDKHHGHIAVESTPGVGTTFTIYLPAVERQVTPQPVEDRELLVGKGKILVMDDEEMVREVLGRMLASLGYEAEVARDGGEAIEMFVRAQGSGQAFAAVILDLTVPGAMGGKETLARLLEIDTQVKAVVSSGYSDDSIMADFKKYGFRGVIAKPYKISELGKILHEVIMGKP